MNGAMRGLISLVLFGIPIAIGVVAQSFWVGFGVWISLVLIVMGALDYGEEEDRARADFVAMCIGFAALITLFAKHGTLGRGWWASAWFATTLSYGVVGISAAKQERAAYSIVASVLALSSFAVFAALCAGFEIGTGVLTASLSSGSNSLLMWGSLVVGFVFLTLGWVRGYIDTEGKPFVICVSIGVGALALSTWLSDFRGGWWWVIPWALAALIIGHASRELRRYYEVGAANWGVLLVILCLIIGVGGPYLAERGWSSAALQTEIIRRMPLSTLSQPDVAATPSAQTGQTATAVARQTAQPPSSPTPVFAATQPTQAPSAEQRPAQAGLDSAAATKSVWNFLVAAVQSIWGIFHLITLFLLGYSWFRRGWAAIWLPLALLIAVWFAGGLSSPANETLTRLISSSPAGWMYEMLHFSVEKFGHAGWGTVLLGVAVPIISLPALRQLAIMHYSIRRQLSLRQPLSGQVIQRYLEESGISSFLVMVNLVIGLVILLGLLVALWVALRQVAQTGEVSLAAWGIPDLAVPNWQPVWQLPYFVLAAVLALLQIILIPLKRKLNVLASGLPAETNPWFILIGTFVTALFVPAGVLLFGAGHTAAQLLSVPLIGRAIAKLEAEEERREQERRRQELARKALEEMLRHRVEALQQREQAQAILPKPAKTLKGEKIWLSPTPLASMLALDNSLYYLTESGDLFRQRESTQKFMLPITRGQALLALEENDGKLLAIGNGKNVLWVDGRSGAITKQATLSSPSDIAVLNPFKTMLVWINVPDRTVRLRVLETGREHVVINDLDLAPALAFSMDGHYLALGGCDGNIYIVNFATRRVAATLTLPQSSDARRRAVRALYARQGGGWVSVHEDQRVTLWSAEHQLEKEVGLDRRILASASHAETNRLALGLSDGILQVFNADLDKCFDETVQEKEISYVCFSKDGRRVFTIGEKTEVRRVDL